MQFYGITEECFNHEDLRDGSEYTKSFKELTHALLSLAGRNLFGIFLLKKIKLHKNWNKIILLIKYISTKNVIKIIILIIKNVTINNF